MSKRSTLGMLLAFVTIAMATAKDVSHKGHVTKTGTYVQPHHQTAPNKTKSDNYSTKGNVNPHTGKPGTKSPTPSK